MKKSSSTLSSRFYFVSVYHPLFLSPGISLSSSISISLPYSLSLSLCHSLSLHLCLTLSVSHISLCLTLSLSHTHTPIYLSTFFSYIIWQGALQLQLVSLRGWRRRYWRFWRECLGNADEDRSVGPGSIFVLQVLFNYTVSFSCLIFFFLSLSSIFLRIFLILQLFDNKYISFFYFFFSSFNFKSARSRSGGEARGDRCRKSTGGAKQIVRGERDDIHRTKCFTDIAINRINFISMEIYFLL